MQIPIADALDDLMRFGAAMLRAGDTAKTRKRGQ
jgi:hypothetical protein